jgi:hypothetical protein
MAELGLEGNRVIIAGYSLLLYNVLVDFVRFHSFTLSGWDLQASPPAGRKRIT